MKRMRDYYESTGSLRDRSADADAIKRRTASWRCSIIPTGTTGRRKPRRFKELTEAYEVLKDGDKRAAYDRFGHAGVKGGAGAGYGGFSFHDALEIFMRDFGGFGRRGRPVRRRARPRAAGGVRKGADMRVITLPLTLDEVATGVQRKLRVELQEPCGGVPAAARRPARRRRAAPRAAAPARCGGYSAAFLGQLVSVMPCPDCGGEGQRIEQPCGQCGGRGVERIRGRSRSGAAGRVDWRLPDAARPGQQPARGAVRAATSWSCSTWNGGCPLHARRRRPRLRAAHHVQPGCAGRRDRGADHRQHGARPDRARYAVRPLLRMRGRGLPHLQGGRQGRPHHPGGGLDADAADVGAGGGVPQLAKVEAPAERVEDGRDRGIWSRIREALTGS
jgi:hypothetical protein